MLGRKLLKDLDPLAKYYNHPDMVQRRIVLKETIDAFDKALYSDCYQRLAMANLKRWKNESKVVYIAKKIQVFQGDWGDVTRKLTEEYGECFVVLNMANAYVPGGGYVEGMSAQEENMFRRTDCHFHVTSEEYDRSANQYHPDMTELISGKNGKVYLDIDNPRVCIRGSEDRSRDDLGYPWLKDDEIFPFYELRASAQDLRGEVNFSIDEARRRIIAQLDTLQEKDVKYAVLGAFGCGAFLNPPEIIATLYREELVKRLDNFSLIAFAVFHTGHGADNYLIFKKILQKAIS